MHIPQIPLPGVHKPSPNFELVGAFDLYRQWRGAYEQAHPAPPIENIRFTHNPEWRDSIWSLTNAREQRHIVWKATGIAFGLGGAALAAGPMVAVGLPIAIVFGLVAVPWVVKWSKDDKSPQQRHGTR